jgi:hypothetical protein
MLPCVYIGISFYVATTHLGTLFQGRSMSVRRLACPVGLGESGRESMLAAGSAVISCQTETGVSRCKRGKRGDDAAGQGSEGECACACACACVHGRWGEVQDQESWCRVGGAQVSGWADGRRWMGGEDGRVDGPVVVDARRGWDAGMPGCWDTPTHQGPSGWLKRLHALS